MKLISITTAPNCSYQIGTILTVCIKYNSGVLAYHDFSIAYTNKRALLKRTDTTGAPEPFADLMENCSNIKFDRTQYNSCNGMTKLHQFINELVIQLNPNRISEMSVTNNTITFKVDGNFYKYIIVQSTAGGYYPYRQEGPYTIRVLCQYLGIPVDIWSQQKEYSCISTLDFIFSTPNDIYKFFKLMNKYFSHENQLCNKGTIGQDDNSYSGCRICCEEDKIKLPKSEISYRRILS